MITADLLRTLGWVDPEAWAALLGPEAEANGITTPRRAALALANFTNETGGGRTLVESLNYKPEDLVRQWPKHFDDATAARVGRTADHPADQEAIANLAYGGRMGNAAPGDGWLYRGAGLIQATGHDNYLLLATLTGKPIASLPGWCATRLGAAQSGCLLWNKKGCNQIADTGDVTRCRLRINGGTIGLPRVKQLYAQALAALGTS